MDQKTPARQARYAENQKRLKLAFLMADAYRNRIRQLEDENARLKQADSSTSDKASELTRRLALFYEENKSLEFLINSLRSSMDKQGRLVAAMEEDISVKLHLPRNR